MKSPNIIELVKKECAPVLDALGVSYFMHLIIYDAGGYTGISSDVTAYNDVFLNNGVAVARTSKSCCCLDDIKMHLAHIVTAVDKYKLLNPKIADATVMASHNNAHLITILDKTAQGLEVFLLHRSEHVTLIDRNMFYSSNRSYLYKFILFYRIQIRKIPALRLIYSKKNNINFLDTLEPENNNENAAIHLRSKELIVGIKRFYIDDGSVYLTRQELRIMKYIIQGKSAKEVAKIIGISYRTIELHVLRVRKKLGGKMHAIVRDYFSAVLQFLD
ncbi:MAG: hypothetical protein COC15_02430 [Legionellales bacterium]|nr:MAG: hypothetical protein COC15_02430 [Legionellales bacterium]